MGTKVEVTLLQLDLQIGSEESARKGHEHCFFSDPNHDLCLKLLFRVLEQACPWKHACTCIPKRYNSVTPVDTWAMFSNLCYQTSISGLFIQWSLPQEITGNNFERAPNFIIIWNRGKNLYDWQDSIIWIIYSCLENCIRCLPWTWVCIISWICKRTGELLRCRTALNDRLQKCETQNFKSQVFVKQRMSFHSPCTNDHDTESQPRQQSYTIRIWVIR